jgi:hypothetical protein
MKSWSIECWTSDTIGEMLQNIRIQLSWVV